MKNMAENPHKHGFGVFSTREEAEQALHELKASGFPMDKVSVIAKEADNDKQLEGVATSDRVGEQDIGTGSGVVGDALTASGLGGVLVGLGSLAIPGIGPIIAAGSFGLALVTTVASTGIGAVAAGNLVKALIDLGLPEEKARVYSDRLLQEDYLAIVNGSEDEVQRAGNIFSAQKIQEWGVY